MNVFLKIFITLVILAVAILTEIFLDRVKDTSWIIVAVKIILAFVIVSGIGLTLKFILDFFNLH